MATEVIYTSLEIGTQIPLDSKVYFLTIAQMRDLGENNFRAFIYFEDMYSQCVETHLRYVWRERVFSDGISGPSGTGVLDSDFVYPIGSIVESISYENRAFNFFELKDGDIYQSELDPGLALPEDALGIPAGTLISELSGVKNYSQMFDALLIKDTPATVAISKAIILVDFINQEYEVGSPFIPAIDITLQQGLIRNGDGTDAGPITGGIKKIEIYDRSNLKVHENESISGLNYQVNLASYTMTKGNNFWKVDLTHEEGTTDYFSFKQNPGTNLDNLIAEQIISRNTINLPAKYYMWYYLGDQNTSPTTSSAIRNLVGKYFLDFNDQGNFQILIPENTQEFSFYYPVGSTIQIDDLGNNVDITSSFILTSTDVADAGANNVSYQKATIFMGLSGFINNTTFDITLL